MSVEKTGSQPIVLDEVLDIANVKDLHARLLDGLQHSTAITLVGSGVERIDTAALQVLCALLHTAKSQGKTVTWQEPSGTLRSSAKLLGLEQILELAH